GVVSPPSRFFIGAIQNRNHHGEITSMDFITALEGYWLARRRDFSQNTINDYSLTFKRFAIHVGSQPIDQITARDIHKFLDRLKTRNKLADKTMANIWTALSSFWT